MAKPRLLAGSPVCRRRAARLFAPHLVEADDADDAVVIGDDARAQAESLRLQCAIGRRSPPLRRVASPPNPVRRPKHGFRAGRMDELDEPASFGRRTLDNQFESEEETFGDPAQSRECLRDCVSAAISFLRGMSSRSFELRGSARVISRQMICKMLIKSCAAGGRQLKHGVAALVYFDEADPSPVRTAADWTGA